MGLKHSSANTKFHIDPKLRQGFKLDEAVILPNNGEVISHEQRRHLPPKAMELLLFLSENRNQIISSEQLLDFGWGDKNTKRSSLSHVISEIRYALDDHKECPEYIQTISRKGYRIIAKLELLDEKILYPNIWPVKEKSKDDLLVKGEQSKRWHLSLALLKNSKLFRVSVAFVITTWVLLQVFELIFPIFNIPSWGLKIVVLISIIGFPLTLLFAWLKEIKIKKLLLANDGNQRERKHFFKQLAFDFSFIGVLSIGVGFLALYLIDSIEHEQSIPLEVKSELTFAQPIKDNLIAVLPFHFEDTVSLPLYFKATFQAEIINALSQQADFNFVSQRAINEMADNSSVSDYVDRLGARYLLDGKIVGDKQQYGILLSLTDTKTSLQVWSTTIQGTEEKLLVTQKELYRQAFNALALLAKHQPSDAYAVISTGDFKAYDSYIQGKNQLAIATNEEQIRVAERHFLNSLSFDPKFSLAVAGLCQTYLDQYETNRQITTFKSAKQSCSSLLSINFLKEDALVSLGNLNRISGEHLQAIEYYQNALQLNADNLSAITGTALSHNQLGNIETAEVLMQRTIQLEPGYWKNYSALGDLFIGNGKYQAATEQYLRVTLLKPEDEQGFNRLGASYYLDEQFEAASIAWTRSLEIRPSAHNYSNLGTALFIQGQFGDAQDSYQKGLRLKSSDPVLWANLGDAQKFDNLHELAQLSYRTATELVTQQLVVNPNDQVSLSMQARYQSELGQCTKALQNSDKILSQKHADPYLYYDLSIAAINCNQLDSAKKLIASAISLGYSKKLLARDIQFSGININNLSIIKGQ